MKEILISNGKTVLVDDEDFSFLSRFTWCARRCSDRDYPITAKNFGGKYHATFMHRMIMNAPPNMVVDHINGNTFDNQKHNLRVCTSEENNRNRSANAGKRFKGVNPVRCRAKIRPRLKKHYHASIYYKGKAINLGYFETELEAAAAYDHKAKELFGEFAKLNLPEPDIQLSNKQAAF